MRPYQVCGGCDKWVYLDRNKAHCDICGLAFPGRWDLQSAYKHKNKDDAAKGWNSGAGAYTGQSASCDGGREGQLDPLVRTIQSALAEKPEYKWLADAFAAAVLSCPKPAPVATVHDIDVWRTSYKVMEKAHAVLRRREAAAPGLVSKVIDAETALGTAKNKLKENQEAILQARVAYDEAAASHRKLEFPHGAEVPPPPVEAKGEDQAPALGGHEGAATSVADMSQLGKALTDAIRNEGDGDMAMQDAEEAVEEALSKATLSDEQIAKLRDSLKKQAEKLDKGLSKRMGPKKSGLKGKDRDKIDAATASAAKSSQQG